jgi:hypothetical protein
MEGSAVFEYTVYIYTSGNESDSASLNDTVNSAISTAVEEKLGVTLTSSFMSGMWCFSFYV